MNEFVDDVSTWLTDGRNDIVTATVLRTWGSAPRRPGAKMAIDGDGHITGSVSGGCVEGAVIEAARQTLETGEAQLLHFGVADETAWSVGLACGGSIDIFVDNIDPSSFEVVHRLVSEERAGSITTVVRGPAGILGQKVVVDETGGASGNMVPDLRERVISVAAAAEQAGMIALDAETTIFVDLIRPSPTLVVVGGGEVAISLTKMARLLGYNTVVIDPRRVFASEARFPHVDRLVQKWPRSAFADIELTPDTAVALLTHDPKIDDPSLKILLDRDIFYIGALGSRKTHAKRLKRLKKLGFTDSQTERICAPIGLDIGAANPQEIAVAIMAEIVAARRGQKKVAG